jgi:hypothetical protein
MPPVCSTCMPGSTSDPARSTRSASSADFPTPGCRGPSANHPESRVPRPAAPGGVPVPVPDRVAPRQRRRSHHGASHGRSRLHRRDRSRTATPTPARRWGGGVRLRVSVVGVDWDLLTARLKSKLLTYPGGRFAPRRRGPAGQVRCVRPVPAGRRSGHCPGECRHGAGRATRRSHAPHDPE